MGKYSFIGIAIVILGIVLFNHWPSTADFCREKRRQLTDAEKIRVVINTYAVGSRDRSIKVRTATGIETRTVRLRYPSSADEVLKANPNCCHVLPWYSPGDSPPPPGPLASWFFGPPTVVSIQFQAERVGGGQADGTFLDKQYRVTERTVHHEFRVNACGRRV